MTRKLGKDVKIARAVCRLKCGRGVKVGQVGEPKPQKGKKEVHVGSTSKGGGIYIPYDELSKEQKAEIMSSGIPNVKAQRKGATRPTVGNVKKMGLSALDKLRNEGVWVRHDKGGKKTFKYKDGKTPPSVVKMVDDEKKRRQDLKSTKTATKQQESQAKKADKKASKDEELKKKLMDKVNNGTERQKKASIAQLNKKFGANLTYTKPEKKAKAPKKAPEPPKKIVMKVKKSVIEAKQKKPAPAKAKKAPSKAQLEARKKFSEMAKAKSKANKKTAPEPAKPAPKPKRKRRTKAEMEADKAKK